MAWFRSSRNNSAFSIIPLTWVGESHNTQNNRQVNINGYLLNSPISSKMNCVGIISVPITVPDNTVSILFKYDLEGLSYTDNQYFATIFCSDNVITNITTKEDAYGYRKLIQRPLDSGQIETGFSDTISVPSNSFYFNIQFGVSGFRNCQIFAIVPNEHTYLESELISNAPIGILALKSEGDQANANWETSVSLGSEYRKIKAIVAYCGPGAVEGATLNGSLSFSINNSPVSLQKVATSRNEALAKALEYWEGNVNPTTDVQSIAYGAHNYSSNNDSRIAITFWILR